MKNTSAPRRTVLTEQEAVGIYRRKPQDANFKGVPTRNSKSRLLAVHFGVSPKTVRDIWNQKTWTFATIGLWNGHANQNHEFQNQALVSAPQHGENPGMCRNKSPLRAYTQYFQAARSHDICLRQSKALIHINASAESASAASSLPAATLQTHNSLSPTDLRCCTFRDASGPPSHRPRLCSAASDTWRCGSEQLIDAVEALEGAWGVGASDPFHDDWPHWPPGAACVP